MDNDKKQVSSVVRWSVAMFAAYALIGSGVTLMGWIAGMPRLTDWLASGISMFPNAAFAGFCAGAALVLLASNRRWFVRVGTILGLIVLLVGGVTLFQHFSGVNLGIDSILINPGWGTKAAVAPGRIGPPASISYTLLGLALVLIRGGSERCRRIVPAFGIAVCAIAVLALMGYVSGADPLFAVAKFTGIAMQTATILLALALGLVASVPEYEPVRTLQSKSAAGLLARRSLPFIVGLPLFLGWLRIQGQRAGWFDTAMGTSLLMLALVVTFCGLLWWWVGAVAEHEQQVQRLHSELKLNLEEMTTLHELLPVGVWIGNRDCSEIRGNAAAYRLFGLPENINASITAEKPELPRGLRIRVNGVDVPTEDLPMQKVARTGEPWSNFEHDINFPDGATKVVYGSVAPLFDEQGKLRRVIGAFADFTERKRIEEERRYRSEQLETLINRAPIGVYLVDADFRIAQINPVALPVFGDISGGVLGRDFDEVIHILWEKEYADETVRIFRHTLRSGESFFTSERAEYRIDRQKIEHYEWRLDRITQPDGRHGLVCYFRDISQQVEARTKLLLHATDLEATVAERTAKLQETVNELQSFSYSIAHDMRAPLRAMGTFAQLLMDELSTAGMSSDTKTYCERIVIGAARLDNLIHDALNYTKAALQEFPLQPVDLSRLVRGLVDTYPNLQAESTNIQIEATLPIVLGNESLLTQCFSNLLGNAVKFVAPGTRPTVRVRSEAKAGFARIWVEDNGIGIPKHAQPRLFAMFQKLDNQYDGTGIGLAIVRKAVERMGGKVGIESEPSRGSRFWIEVRIAPTNGKA